MSVSKPLAVLEAKAESETEVMLEASVLDPEAMVLWEETSETKKQRKKNGIAVNSGAMVADCDGS